MHHGTPAPPPAGASASSSQASFTSDSIRVIGESVGLGSLSDEIASAVASDVEYRLREVIQEAAKFMRRSKREHLTTVDVNSALRLKNVETLYGFGFPTPMRFQRVSGTKDLFYVQDPEVELNAVIERALPECPRDVTLGLHWLAVEGVQPAIPQNPAPPESEIALHGPPPKRAKMEETEVKSIVQHVISKELQLYFNAVTQAIKDGNDKLVTAALSSIQTDPGTSQLLPYFTRFIAEEVTGNLRNLPLLINLMKLADALLTSPHLRAELYLHQLMPSILTCLVGKRLCESPMDDHWALRDYSAKLVSLICTKYGSAYTTVLPRMTKTLLRAFLDKSKPLTTHYGAITGIAALGANAVQLLLIPHVEKYIAALEADMQSQDAVKSLETHKVHSALLNACGQYVKSSSQLHPQSTAAKTLDPALPENYEMLIRVFGESIQPFIVNSGDAINV